MVSKPDSQILAEARAKLDKGWIKFAYAKNVDGEQVWPDNESASCFCAIGAVCNVMEIKEKDLQTCFSLYEIAPPLKFVKRAVNNRRGLAFNIPRYNDEDGMTKEGILDLFDEAIGLAKEAETATFQST